MFPFDRIELRGLVITTIIGTLPHERTLAQPLQIDLSLFVNLRQAGQSDDLGDTVHYGEVTERVAQVVRGAQDRLLERLAERVAESVLAIPRVEAVEVTVAKLRPPVPEQLHSTAVHILRHRRDYPVQAPPKSLSS